MQQEASDELFGSQRHLALLAAMRVVFPAKRDLPLLHTDQSVVGDGHPVCVARQILQHLFRPAEGLLGINHPLVCMERVQESCERTRLGKPRQRTVEGKLLAAKESFQSVAEFTPEHFTQYFLRQEEAGTLGAYPAVTPRGEAAGGHDAVDVRMVAPALTIP